MRNIKVIKFKMMLKDKKNLMKNKQKFNQLMKFFKK